MTTKRINILAGTILGGALLLGTAGLALAQDPTTDPSPRTVPGMSGSMMSGGMTGGAMSGGMSGGAMSGGMSGGMMGGQGMDGAQMAALHASMSQDGTCDPAVMQSMHQQNKPPR